MTIVIPVGRETSIAESASIMVLNAIIGALLWAAIAAVVFRKAVLNLLWFVLSDASS
jgi:hypothetical protein